MCWRALYGTYHYLVPTSMVQVLNSTFFALNLESVGSRDIYRPCRPLVEAPLRHADPSEPRATVVPASTSDASRK